MYDFQLYLMFILMKYVLYAVFLASVVVTFFGIFRQNIYPLIITMLVFRLRFDPLEHTDILSFVLYNVYTLEIGISVVTSCCPCNTAFYLFAACYM